MFTETILISKRDGRKVEFDSHKIYRAVLNASADTKLGLDEQLAERISQNVLNNPYNMPCDSVEQIQDVVEMLLMDSNRKDVAKAYILYRDARNKARGRKQAEMFQDIIATKSNDVTRDNANMNADTPAGMMMKFAAETSKPFVDDYLLSEEAKQAVRGNYIHVHDKDYYPTKSLTCLQHPLDKLLANGFRAGHGVARPAKRIETAAILAAISMECVQNEMHGGQAIPAFDFMLAPYVLLTWKEELKRAEEYTGRDLSRYYDHFPLKDYGDTFSDEEYGDDAKALSTASRETASRVHRVHPEKCVNLQNVL